jgi:hypothetical protein
LRIGNRLLEARKRPKKVDEARKRLIEFGKFLKRGC